MPASRACCILRAPSKKKEKTGRANHPASAGLAVVGVRGGSQPSPRRAGGATADRAHAGGVVRRGQAPSLLRAPCRRVESVGLRSCQRDSLAGAMAAGGVSVERARRARPHGRRARGTRNGPKGGGWSGGRWWAKGLRSGPKGGRGFPGNWNQVQRD